jgi:DNA (cytosine-5)-methyltransferase 1
MARLHGFPDWFRLHVTKWHGARQVGNAVPPALARIIGAAVIEAMALKPTRPSSETSLGDEALLRMDLSQASKYWEVERPVSRRNQRSGARKRKQVDIEAERIAAGV